MSELEVIPGLDILTLFKSGLKLMHTEESAVITDVPALLVCTARGQAVQGGFEMCF